MHSLKETQTILHGTILIEVLGLQLPHSSIISKTQVVWSALVASLYPTKFFLPYFSCN